MYSKSETTPEYKIQGRITKFNGQTAKCNGQNRTLSFTFFHCKYFRLQKTQENYYHLQVYNCTTYTPEIKIRKRNRDRERERARETKREKKKERERESEREEERKTERKREKG